MKELKLLSLWEVHPRNLFRITWKNEPVDKGGESNVKEIFNQFDEFGNQLWHHEVTGPAMKEVLEKELGSSKFRGTCLTTGPAGTLGSADYLKKFYPSAKTAAGESLQCPTMLLNGYGYHRIEGIGDKHIP